MPKSQFREFVSDLWAPFLVSVALIVVMVFLLPMAIKQDRAQTLQRENDMSECLKVRPGFECRAIMERRGLFR